MKFKNYNFKKIEKKWQKRWYRNYKKIWKATDFSKKPKLYILDMFPYPSGEGLHVGHVEGYTATDILSRYFRMKGYNVLHPMGWDAFGLPAENYALKVKKNPMTFVPKNIQNFKRQVIMMGFSYDWSREISTIDPDYYKWTQWLFLQFFKHGLAYEAEAPVNFCPSCKTGLANEEVVQGRCERCGSEVETRMLRQWHLKITAYAERLLEDLKELDWPEKIIEMQKNWIGKSEGWEVDFALEGLDIKIPVFTTRLDTIYGVTFLALSYNHPLALKIAKSDFYELVENYIQNEKKKPVSVKALEKEITGVFTGSYALHPLTGFKIPIWITNYVLEHYGTGAVMGVPAHDSRDYEFSKKFNLQIIRVIKDPQGSEELPFEGEGILINSERFNGLSSSEAREEIGKFLEKEGKAKRRVYYKLRDWIFSRQRYWGEPIPIIKCPKCGNVPVPEKDLPVKLPKTNKFEPTGTGESPLKNIKNWVKTKCPNCKGPAERETNTMPQWAGSCWYYLRYIDPKNKKTFADFKKMKYWLPVDLYVGGAEHAVLHLLYARFWHKFLYDLGLVPTKEPFQKLFNQGLILGPDGQKMSKSRGNVVNPDEVAKEYGVDALRMYEMFMGPLEAEKPWSTEGIKGVFRFLNRIWKLAQIIKNQRKIKKVPEDFEKELNNLIYETTEGIEKMRFNVVISKMMVFEDYLRNKLEEGYNIPKEGFLTFIKLLFPFAPYISQEIWSEIFKKKGFLDLEKWPKYNEKLIKKEVFTFIVQVNGKKRGEFTYHKEDISENEVLEKVKSLPLYEKYLQGKKIKKIIIVKGRLVNFVI
ncbi:MAG: leucine--tRNA ligase [Minisyncoccia bacterium]|mgnify:CR=1 FL=1